MTKQSAVLDDIVVDDSEESAVKSSVVDAVVRRGRRAGDSSIKLKTVVASGLAVAMVTAVAVLGWQSHTKTTDLDQLHNSAAGRAHAEQVALDYATAAANMDFHDLAAWRTRLTKGTTPELTNRLTQASQSMEQIIAPLQWVSTASPIAAKVRSESNGAYSVDCFVSVLTKNSQAPDGIQSTATYQLTLDSRNNWVITEIGGIDSALASKGAPK